MSNSRLKLVQEVELLVDGACCLFACFWDNFSGHLEQANLFGLRLEVFHEHVVVCSEEDAAGSVAD